MHRSHRISWSCFSVNGVFDFKAGTSWRFSPICLSTICWNYKALQQTRGLWCSWKLQSQLEVMLQVIRRRSRDRPPCANRVPMTIIATPRNKLAESCFVGWNSCERCPRSVRLRERFIIRAINKRARRQMARLLFAWAVLSETLQNEYLYGSAEPSPNVSGSAKLEHRHKIEVTLIDYLELICIFRVIMCVGNRTNRHSRLCKALMMFLITLSSPKAAGKISKGLSLQIWTINEQTWSRGDVWKWVRRGPLSEAIENMLTTLSRELSGVITDDLISTQLASDPVKRNLAWRITLLTPAVVSSKHVSVCGESSLPVSIYISSHLSPTQLSLIHIALHFFYTSTTFRSIPGKLSYFESISCSTWVRCSIKIPFLDIPKNIIVQHCADLAVNLKHTSVLENVSLKEVNAV